MAAFENLNAEAVARRCSVKKIFLEISQIHRKTPIPESLSLKVLTVFCETVFGFLEQSANRDSKWFSDIRKPNGFTHTGN